MMDMDDWNT